MDLGFLGSDQGISNFVDRLFMVHALFMSNDEPDIRDIELASLEDMELLLRELFPDPIDTIQIVVPNGHESRFICGYFRLILSGYGLKSPVNYKFETFMRKANITMVLPRCKTAFVVGLEPIGHFALSVPSVFRLSSLESLQFVGDMDMTCLQSVANKTSSSELAELAGGCYVPACLPSEIQWHIFKYLQHPCADIIKEYWKVKRFWDLRFLWIRVPFMDHWSSGSDSSDDNVLDVLDVV